MSYINQCSQIENEALDWLILLDGDEEPTEQQLSELKQWLAQSETHRQALRGFNDFWNDQALTELFVQVQPKTSKKTRYFFGGVMATAASIMFVAVVAWLFPDKNIHTETFATLVGEQKRIELTDGSVLHLDTNSRIRVLFNDEQRDLFLQQGQAYFDVAKDKQRPFRVYAGNGRVEAIGTEFSVELAEGALKLLVTEGVVAVAKSLSLDDEKRFEYVTLGAVNAGNRYNLLESLKLADLKHNFNQRIEAVNEAELAEGSAWVSGALVFDNEPLSLVVEKINKYSTKPLLIKDPNIANLKIGGRFNVGDLDAFLNLLEAGFSVKVEQFSNEYVLTSAN
ncbi:FecR family protein [Gayadomonas joobiniege]|uniref:FecR family protein n=1 Tax=Gayadomonas joobiniege TaxID=1234606 RepID=UPI00138AE4AF|nr:FecR domain-containing protein [Gayadomonas joobiniege]